MMVKLPNGCVRWEFCHCARWVQDSICSFTYYLVKPLQNSLDSCAYITVVVTFQCIVRKSKQTYMMGVQLLLFLGK